MKRKIISIISIAVAVIILWMAIRFILGGDEDTWLCTDNGWVKHGNPNKTMPNEPCGAIKPSEDKIKVIKPQPNGIISIPLEIEGEARGFWFFEASFPIKLLNKKGELISVAIAQAQSDWMTEDFVAFKAKLDLPPSLSGNATLVFEKDNPSGLPENDDKVEIPVILKSVESMKVKVFFNNDKLDPEFSCNKVFAVEREIVKTRAVAGTALEELFKGPTEKEKQEGFFTSINSGVKIQKLAIENGTAKVDFDEQLEFQVGGSCRVSAIRSEITQTLKQFPTVKDVLISINGRTEDILQP